MPPLLGMQSLNSWTTKEVPAYCLLISFISLCIGDLNFYTYRKFIGFFMFFIFAKCFLRSQLSPCLLKKHVHRGIHGGPVVKISPSSAGSVGSIPSWGA